MKYYYNGKLVRTSKTREYTHAVLHNGACVACSSSAALAEKAMNKELSALRGNLSFYKDAAKAVASGKHAMWTKVNGRAFKVGLDRTAEEYAKAIEWTEDYMNGWEVVELEARA